MYIGLYVKYPLFLSDLNETVNFLERFSKNTQMYKGLYVKYPLFLSDLNETVIFRKDFRKILRYQI